MRTLALAGLALLLVAPAAQAEYSDPWGLPSGSAILTLTRIDSILAGVAVQGFDFTEAAVDSLGSYAEQVTAGRTDLIFVEMDREETTHWLRAPEDPVYELDRHQIDDMGELTLAEVQVLADFDSLQRFVPATLGQAYTLLQIDAAASPESTAVKLRISALTDSTVTFDWVWQPNGEMSFQPLVSRRRSLGAVKALY